MAHRWSSRWGSLHPEITWTIWDGDDEGEGYAIEAGRGFTGYAAKELGFKGVIACVRHDNSASSGLAERLGGILSADTPPPKWLTDSVVYDFNLTA